MQPEQQQRIMGYFIEEAKDHLNTIEQGLLSLQSTIEDTEMMNEVFRAAHSVKGGAGMLGINSIHKTAHRLEDYLKFLQESPVKVDSKLETLFLQVFDTLEGLVEQLQSPFGLTEEAASGIMSDATPVFEQLNTHLEQLIRKTVRAAIVGDKAAKAAQVNGLNEIPRSVNVQPSGKDANVLPATFKRDVLVQLREMLQLFKRQDSPEHREQLQAYCRSLESIGEAQDLPGWSELLETSRLAIGDSDNSYRQLAGLVIKEIKQAQELALANRSVEIAPSAQLKAMVPIPEPIELEPLVEKELESSATDIEQDIASTHNGNLKAATSQNSESSVLDALIDVDAKPAQELDLTLDYYTNRSTRAEGAISQASEMSDPEVGIAELNSLADIFEGQTPDLDQTWQEEEVINLNEPDVNHSLEDLSLDDSGDFGDLNNFELTTTQTVNSEDLSEWVEDETTNQKSATPLPNTSTSTNNTRQNLDADFSDLLFASNSPDQRIIGNTEADELNNLFGDSFFEENQDAEASADFEFDEQGMLIHSPESGVDEADSNNLDDTNQDDFFAFTNQDSDSDALTLEDLSSEQSLFEALDLTPTSELNDDLLDSSNSAEELWLGEEAADFGLEELTFDDVDNLDGSSDFSLEDLLNTESQPTTADDANSALFLEDEPEADTSAPNLEIEELWSLAEPISPYSEANGDNLEALTDNFDFEESSTDLFDFEQEDYASTDDLLAPQLSAAVAFDQNNFDELFPQTTQTTDLDALTFEGIDLESLEGTEISDFDAFNNLFDDMADEPESLSFDDFALIDEATSNTENVETIENGHSELLPQQDTTAAQLDVEATEEEIDLSEFLFESADTAQTEQVAVDDLDMLLAQADELNFEDDLLPQDASPQAENTETTASAMESATIDELDSLLEITADDTAIPVETELASLDEEWADADVDDVFNWDTTDVTESSDDWLNEATPVSSAENWELESDQEAASQNPEFDDLEDLLAESQVLPLPMSSRQDNFSEFEDLEALLGESSLTATNTDFEGFDDLDAFLNLETAPASTEPAPTTAQSNLPSTSASDFGDLEELLEQAYKTMGGPPKPAQTQGQPKAAIRPRPKVFEQTMRVPVKHLDSLSNLVGELVVNRNSLEQDQERLRQFLDNLSHQVLALSDVGSRMQDLYERSLLESSLLASRHPYRIQSNNFLPASSNNQDSVEYDPLEMDRFTGFHLLSQEMIELIVRVRESASDIEFLVDETDQVARMLRQVTTQLQEGLTRSRMVPFAQTADRLPRAVRDISQRLGKEAKLYVEGRETLIDKMILEHLSDPMTHLINNALTHGIETPDIRRAAGKSATGKITLKAFHQGNQTVISVSDDGAGVNPERVRAKAVERRLISAEDAKSLTNLDLYNFLFHPGFTTKDKEDEYAGRGVGMDVVLTSMSEIRGTVHVDSTLGKGTTFTIRLPLTLSICKALCCLSDRARIAFPMDGVEDMLDIPSDRIQLNSEGQTCIKWREALLPFQSLSQLLKYNRQLSRGTVYGGKREDDMISIVVLRSAGNFIAIQVDQVLGEQEIVIKQLEGPAPKPVGIAGATVLGDGRIMPIADVLELIDLAMGRIRKDNVNTLWSHGDQNEPPEEPHITKTEPLVLIVDDSITVRELLSMTFSKSGYRVEQARDGQEAWDKLRSGLPCDIVFCDIEMPRMDGLELLSRLQKDETLCNLPIAMLTSRGADRHRQMASQLGANGYFTKPYLEEVLLEAAQRMIKGEVLFGSNSTSNA